jgi:putative flippase GtrA
MGTTLPNNMKFRAPLERPPRKGSVRLKAISFGLVGAINTLVDFGIFWIASTALGLSPLPANVLAWFVAVSGSYVMNCLTTFSTESGRKLALRTYAGFVASGVGGLVVSTAVLLAAATVMPVLVAKLVAIAASFAFNFSLSHFVIFRPAAKIEPRPSQD